MVRRFLLIALALSAFVPTSLSQGPLIAHLAAEDGDPAGLEAIRKALASAQPGRRIEFLSAIRELAVGARCRALFVQRTRGATLAKVGAVSSPIACGDVVALRGGEEFRVDSEVDLLILDAETAPAAGVPTFVRPDDDPRILDSPGGCAAESGAYRRILLTWSPDIGPYVWRGLNAHRLRLQDSFTHFHPPAGGFEEFYLVQSATPGACLISSNSTAALLDPRGRAELDPARVLRRTPLSEGDLVYLPRGLIHRGLGGAMVQVIAVPGFRPGAEIGVDHLIAALNRERRLLGEAALPFHDESASRPRLVSVEGREAECTIDGAPFFRYRSEGLSRPVLFPLVGPKGIEVTRGFPIAARDDGESRDHPHHAGLWLAHGSVNGVDFWDTRPGTGRIRTLDLRPTPTSDGLVAALAWEDPQGRVLLAEDRTFQPGVFENGDRFVDVLSRLTAKGADRTFGDTKEGFFALRLRDELALKGERARGRAGNSSGGVDAEVWGARARWVDYHAELGGTTIGVAILDHPENHAHPTWWHARDYGLFAANPFGVRDFEGKAAEDGSFVLAAEATVTFRYRLILHLQDAERAGIETRWQEFAGTR